MGGGGGRGWGVGVWVVCSARQGGLFVLVYRSTMGMGIHVQRHRQLTLEGRDTYLLVGSDVFVAVEPHRSSGRSNPHLSIRYHIDRYIAASPPPTQYSPNLHPLSQTHDQRLPNQGRTPTKMQTQPPPRSRSGVTRARDACSTKHGVSRVAGSFERQKAHPVRIYAENKIAHKSRRVRRKNQI
jgi:hypothetical protein